MIETNQQRIDRFILAFTVLLIVCMVGLISNNLTLIIVPLPVMLAVLMLLGSLDINGRWPSQGSLMLIIAFNVLSVALWVIALVSVGSAGTTLAGIPLEVGILVVVAWPVYTAMSGPLYAIFAYRSERDTELRLVRQEGQESGR